MIFETIDLLTQFQSQFISTGRGLLQKGPGRRPKKIVPAYLTIFPRFVLNLIMKISVSKPRLAIP